MSKCSSCACDFDACCDRMAKLEAELAEVTKRCADMATIAERRGTERDAERAAHARTQADAAAMRKAIGVMVPTIIRCFLQDDLSDVDRTAAEATLARVEAAMSGNAGRALAERVTKLEAVAQAAQAFVEHQHYEKLGKLRKTIAAIKDPA